MELIKETINIGEVICEKTEQIMVDGDVIVPEIKPDMLKILQVDAVSSILQTVVDDGKIIINGQLYVTVLYVPDCENEKIRSVEMKFPFEKKLENPKIETGMNIVTDSNVERLEFSAQNSRKLKIKAIIGVQYEVVCVKETEIACGAESESVQLKSDTITLSNISAMVNHKFTVEDNIEVPSGQKQINELLKTDVKILDTEYKNIDGKIVLKGLASVCVLYTDDECNIEFTETEIPFTEIIEAENVSEDSVCDIDYSVLGVDSSVLEDSDGDRRIIQTEVDICAQIKAVDNTEMEIIRDCYEPYMKTELQKSVLHTGVVEERVSVQNTLREIIDFENDAPEVKGVYNVDARPVISKTELRGGKLVCEGNLETYILYLSEDDDNPVYSIKRSIPFSSVLDYASKKDSLEAAVKAEIKHVSYNLNVAGELELRCIMAINGELIQKQSVEIIDEVIETPADKKSGIIIYFVQQDDDLWKIAKHYGVPCEDIMKYNNMDDEDVKMGMNLFIPVCN